jgi:endonuclease G
MMKLLFVLIAALFPAISIAAEQAPPRMQAACADQLPYGMPTMVAKNPVICRSAYILMHDPVAKIPRWVAWTLTPKHSIGCVERDDAFAADQSLPEDQRSTPQDYAGSGYDQGHLANNADMSWDPAVARESFIMSNMSPQLPTVNRGTWKMLETQERAVSHDLNHIVTIYAGNIYTASSKTIGKNRVVVPNSLYKILVDNNTRQSYAFIMPNIVNIDADYIKYQVTVADVEKASGITFPTPDSKTNKNEFPKVDTGKVAADKKTVCNK